MKIYFRNFLLFFIFFFNTCVFSKTNIAIINFDNILKKSVVYNNFINNLNKNVNKKYIILKKKIDNIIKKEKILDKNILNNNSNLKNEILSEKNKVYENIYKLELFYNEKSINIRNKFFLKVKNIINNLVKNYNYDLVIDSSVVIYNNSKIIDISKNIIDIINKKYV